MRCLFRHDLKAGLRRCVAHREVVLDVIKVHHLRSMA